MADQVDYSEAFHKAVHEAVSAIAADTVKAAVGEWLNVHAAEVFTVVAKQALRSKAAEAAK